MRLVSSYGYKPSPTILEVERVYKSVGRPGKGGRVDVIVRKKSKDKKIGEAFLFIECKSPGKFDDDMGLIDGQLFRLSKQEDTRPKYLVYFTTDLKSGILTDRIILIDTTSFSDFESWDDAGQPIVDTLPARYGAAVKRRYAKVDTETNDLKPLDKAASQETFNRIRNEIHDVIWGGGGTNNNDVFVYITKLILCKIFDEQETIPGKVYEFQRRGDAVEPEHHEALTGRMNDLYKEAEGSYLALPKASEGPAFDANKISPQKIAYVVGRLEGISVTENIHEGDLLGEFFEQIVSQDFTQTKGQFFTPPKIVKFILYLMDAPNRTNNIMLKQKDHLGRHRLPYVIDPSCGSGSFLIEFMKLITYHLGNPDIARRLPDRLKVLHQTWFSGYARNMWAKDYLFGIENNYDLGMAAKVNMVLHGDGSMNTWIMGGLLPFKNYWIDGRHNLLGTVQETDKKHPYANELNEQYDFLISNPPFSIKMSPDEKKEVAKAFGGKIRISETLFIERWYQLLREGGLFCCILPEGVLDTSTNEGARLFLLQHFKILAVISLPYDAFRPFTSTKTAIILAQKRTGKEVADWHSAIASALKLHKDAHDDESTVLTEAISLLGWDKEDIFMAEPTTVGYKRRKNLSDLPMPNELYREDIADPLSEIETESPTTVLEYFKVGKNVTPSPILGFYTNILNVVSRKGCRLDPKYRWLWDYQDGIVYGNPSKAIPLSKIIKIIEPQKIPKGDLAEERQVIDLEYIESRQAIVRPDVPVLDSIGSDKIKFSDEIELAFSKLEPYLGKVIIQPPAEALGSTEWVCLKRKSSIPLMVLAYLLMLPEMCEGYRRLQSGKRHARFDPNEFLTLKLQIPSPSEFEKLAKAIKEERSQIIDMRTNEKDIRRKIDDLFK